VKDLYGLGSLELGVMNGAAAAGGVIAAVVIASVADHARAWVLYAAISLAFGALLAAFALAPGYVVALPLMLLLGAAEVGFIALSMGLGMRYAHRDYAGRVQSLILSSFSLLGVAALPLGLLMDGVGIRETLLLEGVAGVAAVFVILVYARRVRAPEDARPEHELKRALDVEVAAAAGGGA
jgi:predicted MFS family arabinose efflux permease